MWESPPEDSEEVRRCLKEMTDSFEEAKGLYSSLNKDLERRKDDDERNEGFDVHQMVFDELNEGGDPTVGQRYFSQIERFVNGIIKKNQTVAYFYDNKVDDDDDDTPGHTSRSDDLVEQEEEYGVGELRIIAGDES
eukprot:2147480-Pyramimonas_sp.AAC.1